MVKVLLQEKVALLKTEEERMEAAKAKYERHKERCRELKKEIKEERGALEKVLADAEV